MSSRLMTMPARTPDFKPIDRKMVEAATPSGPCRTDRPDREWRKIRDGIGEIERLRDEPDGTYRLVLALSFLAESLHEVGHDDLALNARLECVAECRRLNYADREYARRLRWTLTTLRENLVQLERFEDALQIAREEQDLYRAAVDDDSGPERARGARHAITEILTSLGRHDEALASAATQVRQCRQLPDESSGMRKPLAIAYALKDYATRLASAGRHEEALSATKEAVEIWRTLKSERAALLVEALDALVQRLARLKRFAEVAPLVTELSSSWDGLQTTSQWDVCNLAAALHNAGNTLRSLGLSREALDVYGTSLVWHRKLLALAKSRSDEGAAEHVRDAARRTGFTLRNFALMLSTMNRRDEALAIYAEAIELARSHTDEDEELGLLLNNQACLLDGLGDHAAAVAAAAEAVSRLSEPHAIAMARITLSVALSSAGRHDEALAESLASLAAYETLSDDPFHAHAWHDHGLIRSRRGEHAEALAATAEAVRRFEKLDPDRNAAETAEALLRFAEVRFVAGESLEPARDAAIEATKRYALLATRSPEAFDGVHERARKLAAVLDRDVAARTCTGSRAKG